MNNEKEFYTIVGIIILVASILVFLII